MSIISTLLGRPLATSESREQEIGVLSGVPVLGLDALSSAAYGPEAAPRTAGKRAKLALGNGRSSYSR